MPGFDKTGPMGNGPMSGRGMGNCSNTTSSNQPRCGLGFRGRGRGRGMALGKGMGYGRGFGNAFNANAETNDISSRINELENELQILKENYENRDIQR